MCSHVTKFFDKIAPKPQKNFWCHHRRNQQQQCIIVWVSWCFWWNSWSSTGTTTITTMGITPPLQTTTIPLPLIVIRAVASLHRRDKTTSTATCLACQKNWFGMVPIHRILLLLTPTLVLALHHCKRGGWRERNRNTKTSAKVKARGSMVVVEERVQEGRSGAEEGEEDGEERWHPLIAVCGAAASSSSWLCKALWWWGVQWYSCIYKWLTSSLLMLVVWTS